MRMVREGFIVQLTFIPRMFPVNAYLVEEDRELTLIDTAMSFSVNKILQAAEKIGKPITRIVLTHAHSDHVGGLDGLKQQLKNVPVYISKRDSRLLEGDVSLNKNEPNTPIRGGIPKKLTVRADVLLEENDRIGSLLAMSVPGHTPGSMSFLDTRSGAVIAGDAFQTRGGTAVSGQVRLAFPFPAFATWNKEEALKSVYKIKSCQPSLLAVGHGRMIRNPAEEIEKAIGQAERSITQKTR